MKKIVIKIGSNILTGNSQSIDTDTVSRLADDINEVITAGFDVVVVSSGAVAAGMKKLGLQSKPKEIVLRQAVAAIGQSSLIHHYDTAFSKYQRLVAQILLTRDDFSVRNRYLNARNTITTLLNFGVIPIINENDTVSTDEIKFGDNDTLAALVAGLIDADILFILSDVDGLYTCDPRTNPNASIISKVCTITPEIEAVAGTAGSTVGTGGMQSKISAAKKANSFGIPVQIINGRQKGLLIRALHGDSVGTKFEANAKKLTSKKGWIAHASKPKGTLFIDDGACKAIIKKGKSLLPSGITAVEGDFKVADTVLCMDLKSRKIAKGISNYSSQDIRLIMGKKTSEIEKILGYKYSDEVIHRDNLVVILDV